MRRKKSLNQLLKDMKKVGEQLQGVSLDKDSRVAKLQLDMMGIAARVRKEGIQ